MLDEGVGKRIKELREIQHLTRERLAEDIDISAKFLYEIELGQRNFSVEVLNRLSNELSVSCDYIIKGEEVTEGKNEKVNSVIGQMNTKQIQAILKLLKVLYEICDVL